MRPLDHAESLHTPEAEVSTHSFDRAKALGAYYTTAQVADFLVWWSVRTAHDMVLDPSFGGGVFLRSACKRLLRLGGNPAHQVLGIELDPIIHTKISQKLYEEFGVRKQALVANNFFRISSDAISRVDAVVGNPPFIRYQRFSGEIRNHALRTAKAKGVHLSSLASSWAPFLIHAASMLIDGGRLAMVAPFEISHASYAKPLLTFFRRSFRDVTLLTFRKKLFPDLSENTLLILAEGKGEPFGKFDWRDLADPGELNAYQTINRLPLQDTHRLDAEAICNGQQRLLEYYIPKKARTLYRELSNISSVKRLGDLAEVGIGYVTGANSFFHLDPAQVERWRIPQAFLLPAVRRGRTLSGIRLTKQDWRNALSEGESSYLLYIRADSNLPATVARYVAHGEREGVPKAYKCRVRSPWYSVPHVYRPDALLSYMSGRVPMLVANEASVVAPNSLHIVRLHADTALTSQQLAALWQTSLSRLSAELEGHPLGGGMLKLEPTEAKKALLPILPIKSKVFSHLIPALDTLLRTGRITDAENLADETILKRHVGLSMSDIRILRDASKTLRERRYEISSIR